MKYAAVRSGSAPWRRSGVCRGTASPLTLVAAAVLAGPLAAQEVALRPEVPLEIVSAEIVRFPAPIRIGVGERAVQYSEALLLTVEVAQATMDSLPPALQPFLYLARREYSIFKTAPGNAAGRLQLIFHIPDWPALEEDVPVVLTVDRGAPVRDPDRFRGRDLPRLQRATFVDRRAPKG